jgi:hypothetical protein
MKELFKRPKGGSQNERTKEEESWGTLPNLQHFGEEEVLEL